MKTKYTFRNIDHTDPIVEHCEERIAKMKRYVISPLSAHITVSNEGRLNVVEIYVHGSNLDYQAKAQAGSFPSAVDQAFSRITKQMKKKKEKVQSYKGGVEISAAVKVESEVESEEEYYEQAG